MSTSMMASHGQISTNTRASRLRVEGSKSQISGARLFQVNEIELVTQISKENQFISLGRTTYGDDIKQFFTAVTMNGEIYTSEKLDSWTKMASIPLSK